MNVIISGGSGLIGRNVSILLAAHGHSVKILSRYPDKIHNIQLGIRTIYWDGKSVEVLADLVENTDVVINFAGESIAGNSLFDFRWTLKKKERILRSRLVVSEAIVRAFEKVTPRKRILLQASAVGYYGNDKADKQLDEQEPPGYDFLAGVCVAWERSTVMAENMHVRRAVLRLGVVLSAEGGVLPRQILPFRFFVGGPLGDGKQWISWIHIDDVCRAVEYILDRDEMQGIYNVTAPEAVTNADFSRLVGKYLHRPSSFQTPAFILKSLFGESYSLLCKGQRVFPKRLIDENFEFNYPDISMALDNLL